jgi:hypothetical protein
VGERAARPRRRRLLTAALVVGLLAALGARVAWSIGQAGAEPPFKAGDPGVVTNRLHPTGGPGSAPAARSGTLTYRDGTWHSVIDLRGLPAPGPGRRTLVFARYANGWVLLGGTTPTADGAAQIHYRADPPAWKLFEIMVTEGVDTGQANPHGRPLLRWVRADLASFNREPWPIELVR